MARNQKDLKRQRKIRNNFFFVHSRHGFNTPILVKEKSGLDITVPDSSFTVSDVRNFVGAKRVVDIMDCTTQKNSEMTMKEWEDYYTSSNR